MSHRAKHTCPTVRAGAVSPVSGGAVVWAGGLSPSGCSSGRVRTVWTADVGATSSAAGTSDIYAVKFGLDAFCGISPQGTGVITSYMPDLALPGAVKKGEVELVAGVALKNSLKAGRMTGIKTSPQTGD